MWLEHVAPLVAVVRADGCVTYLNRAGGRYLGIEAQSALGAGLARLGTTDETRAALVGAFGECQRTDLSRFELRGADPRAAPLQARFRRVSAAGDCVLVGLEQHLTQGSLELSGPAVEHMAASFSHEVDNAVSGIRGVVEILAGRLPEGSGDATVMYEVVSRLDRLHHNLEDFMAFLRPLVLQRVRHSLREVVLLAVDAVAKRESFARLHFEVDGDAPEVVLDPGAMQRALRRLLENAAEANLYTGAELVRVTLLDRGDQAWVSIDDGGPGVDASAVAELFFPFRGTKPASLGLGLSEARRLVRAHGGDVLLEPRGGDGARAWLHLPSAPADRGRER